MFQLFKINNIKVNRHSRLEGLINDLACRLCLEEAEELAHLLFECPTLWHERAMHQPTTPHTKGLFELFAEEVRWIPPGTHTIFSLRIHPRLD